MQLYRTHKIHDNLYILEEYLGDHLAMTMPLVIGENRAALIDTGLGSNRTLPAFIKTITDLPITVLCTHGHCDHVGAVPLFDDVYLCPADAPLLEDAMKVSSRMACVNASSDSEEKISYIKKHMVPPSPLSYHALHEGDTFELGGVCLEALAFPGHTPGGMVFLDQRDGCIFTGDSVTDMPWLFLKESMGATVPI